MRTAAQIKGGFYAAHPDAVRHVMQHVTAPSDGLCTVLDPCAGEGEALSVITDHLRSQNRAEIVPYAVELDDKRSEACQERFSHVIPTADFLGCSITDNCFSMAWVNPPFDYASGGEGRVESHFVDSVMPLVVPDGLIAMVAPEDIIKRRQTLNLFACYCDRVRIIPFPELYSPFTETVILGAKRAQPKSWGYGYWQEWNEATDKYQLPSGSKPITFRKVEPTDEEVLAMLARSPNVAAARKPRSLPRPPIPPGAGHRALLLASGLINGLIQPEGEPPHVLRGLAKKERFLRDSSSTDDGKTETTVTRYSEKINLVIRTLDNQGTITTILEE